MKLDQFACLPLPSVKTHAVVHSTLLLPVSPRFLLLSLALFSTTLPASAADAWRSLFNGRDLTGWTTWLQKPHASSVVAGLARNPDGTYREAIGVNKDPLQVFTVVNVDGRPALRVSGEAFGEIRTVESFQNYHLKLQFKWGVKKWPPRNGPAVPRDSGLLYHVHAPPGEGGRTWPRSIELQIQEHDVGDLYAVTSLISVRSRKSGEEKPVFTYDPTGDWADFSQVKGSVGRCVKYPDAEKAHGEWNTVELICLGEESLHIVNGTVVMRLHNPRRIDRTPPESVTAGPLALQSEGAELFYRDITIRPITEIPAAYAVKP